jgi:acetyl esterase/lipase
MIKRTLLLFILTLTVTALSAQDKVIKVWPNGAPNNNGMSKPEVVTGDNHVSNISEAVLYVYLPEKEKNTGVAIVLCPGGGYSFEAMNFEGHDIAKWLIKKGIAGIVLKYRLPYGHPEVPLSDAKQAIRIVRQNAGAWGIDSGKVGIAGASAGGHLASMLATHFDYGEKNSKDPVDHYSSRPDFVMLQYPVISLKEEITEFGTRNNLIGKGHNLKLIKEYSNELHVTEQTPPAFIVVANDDELVSSLNSAEFYLQLKKHNVPAELHVFAEGHHGFYLKKDFLPVRRWPDMFYDWMTAMNIVE